MSTDREEFEQAVLACEPIPGGMTDLRKTGDKYKDARMQWVFELWQKAREGKKPEPDKVRTLFDGLAPEGVPKPEVLAILEEALEEAKKGNVESLAIAYVRFSGGTTTNWENAQNTLRAIGAVSHLLARMNLDLIQACVVSEAELDA